MNDFDILSYKKLFDLPGISANETIVRRYIKEELSKHCDNVEVDKWGSTYAIHKGDGPVVMVDSHMDEVGCMVKGITHAGMLRLIPIGSINADVMISQQLDVIINENESIRGIICTIPPHLTRGEATTHQEVPELLLDIGCNSQEEVLSLGINVGTMCAFVNDFHLSYNKQRLYSKAIDDRFGCLVCLEINKRLKEINHPNTVIVGSSVQEEVGTRGTKVTTAIYNPDLFIAVDVSPVIDFLGKDTTRSHGALGDGFLVRFYDPGCIMHNGLKKFIMELADKHNIKHQFYQSKGGTNAVSAQYGVNTIACTIGLPARYIHSTCAMADLSDMQSVIDIVVEMIKAFDNEALKEVIDNA